MGWGPPISTEGGFKGGCLLEDVSPGEAERSSLAWGGSEHVTVCWVSVVPLPAGKTLKLSTCFSFLAKFVGVSRGALQLALRSLEIPLVPLVGKDLYG